MAASKQAAKTRAATTFHDHLKELRRRAFVIVAVFIVASSVAYNYKDWLLSILMRPLGGEKLIYLTPAGGFSFIFQVTVYAGLIVTIPVLVYNIFRFIAPVLSRETRFYSAAVVISSMLLLGAGVCFGYFYAIPAAMSFLIHFADGFANASLTAESYLGFVMAYTAGLGLLFQLPLLLLFIHWIYPLKPKKLLSFERYMVLIAFVAAAIISPTPDALNQTIIAAPIILMYQIGIIAVWASVRRQKKKTILAANLQKNVRHRPVESPFPARPQTPMVSAVQAATSIGLTGMSTASTRQPVRSINGLRTPVRPPQRLKRPAVRPQAKVAVGVARSLSRPGRSIDGVSIILKELDDSII